MQEKEIEIEGTTFKIKKFTPDVACFWATRLFGDLMSKASGISRQALAEFVQGFTKMERKDFSALQKDCLSFIQIKFESGWHPLLNSEGYCTKTDLSNPDILALMTHSFMFSISDFFAQSRLESLLGAFPEDTTEKTENGSENWSPSLSD